LNRWTALEVAGARGMECRPLRIRYAEMASKVQKKKNLRHRLRNAISFGPTGQACVALA
jgi:hypothetical protein